MSISDSIKNNKFFQYIAIGVGLFVVIFVISMAGSFLEDIDSGEIVICQDPFDGELHFYTSPGVEFQNFGTCTHYEKSTQIWFSYKSDEGGDSDQSIRVRFNDGASATLSGSVRVELPLSDEMLGQIHSKFGNQEAVIKELVRTVIEKAVYMTGPLMSSTESYAEKRSDLIRYIEDQASNGVYKTQSKTIKKLDQLSKKEKSVVVTIISRKKDGSFKRQEKSPLMRFEIKLYNLAINKIAYSKDVERQIEKQQQAKMEVQTAIADALKAEQRAITADKEGQATAATAKWAKEKLKAEAIVVAQQELEVAILAKKAAVQTKQKDILLGQGEGARKRAVMIADGALTQKLAVWKEVNLAYAKAIENYKGNWVPTTNFGGKVGGGGNGANALIQMFTAKTANDLSLSMKTK